MARRRLGAGSHRTGRCGGFSRPRAVSRPTGRPCRHGRTGREAGDVVAHACPQPGPALPPL